MFHTFANIDKTIIELIIAEIRGNIKQHEYACSPNEYVVVSYDKMERLCILPNHILSQMVLRMH